MKIRLLISGMMSKVKSIIARYKGETNFAISNIITSCISLITGVIAATFIGPEELGIIQTVLLVSTYASFIHLGVFSGLNRNLAYYKAKEDFKTMQDEINTSYIISYIVSAISGFIGIGVFVYYFINGYNNIYLFSCVFLIATLILTPIITNIEATYKSGQEFNRLGNIKNIQSVIYLVVSFLPAVIGVAGRIVAGTINMIIGYILRILNPPYKRTGNGSFKSFKDLLYTGFPILISGYIWSVTNVIDKTYIAASFTPRDVGLYTIAVYCVTLFMMIPTSISALLYPKAAAIYGKTGEKNTLLGFWNRSLLLMIITLIPIIIVAYIILPSIVDYVMPLYTDGIVAARITLLTCSTFIYFGPSALFGTLKKNVLNIIVQIIILALFLLILNLFRNYFITIESVAWLRFALSFIHMIFVLIYTRYLLLK